MSSSDLVIKTGEQFKSFLKSISEASGGLFKGSSEEKAKQDKAEDDLFADKAKSDKNQNNQQMDDKKDKKVSLKKAAAGGSSDPAKTDLSKGDITVDMVVDKLNQIRGGHSFKDENIAQQLNKYFNDLSDSEKLALFAFMQGLSQIASGQIPGEKAVEPSEPPANVKMERPDEKNVKTIKPTIIKKGNKQPKGNLAPTAGKEDTKAPKSMPVQPKIR